jgi:hypothetical protein
MWQRKAYDFAMLLILSTLVFSAEVNISNTVVRHDVNGNQMDTHDGNIIQLEGKGLYYFYSMGYQDCVLEHSKMIPQECPGIYKPFGACGFRTDHALRVYSTSDFVSWNLVAEDALAYDDRPYGIYFRPKVIHNKKSGQYILWINHLPEAINPLAAYPNAGLVVAVSMDPSGPFKVINERASLAVSNAGDFSLLVDTDVEPNVAYIAYDAWGNDHQVSVEQLNSDFTDSLGTEASSGVLSPSDSEAPILFKRNNW